MTKESLEEKIAEPLAKLYVNHINQTETIIRCDNISIDFWQMELKSLLDNEPFYMFKKKHLEWEEKVKQTKKHLEHLYISQEKTMKDLRDFKSVNN